MIGVQIFHTLPLPRNFSISEDPYTPKGLYKVNFDTFGVLFWRDSDHSDGVTHGIFKGPAKILRSQMLFNEIDLCVDEWTDELIEKHSLKDKYAWQLFNKNVDVLEITRSHVRLNKEKNGTR